MRTSDQEFVQYFPIGERDRQWGLYVSGVGSTSMLPGYPSYPKSVHPDAYMYTWQAGRVLHEYQAVYILRGPGVFESKTTGPQKVVPGTLMLLFPGEWHRYRPDRETGWDEYWVSFAGEQIDGWVRQEFFSPASPLLCVGMDESLLHHFQELVDQTRAAPIGFQQIAAADVHRILAAALAAVRRLGMTDRNEEIVRQAKAFLEENVERTVSMPVLARSLHISEDHFRRLFKHHTGMAPYEYYLELKMHRARQLLCETKLTLRQIAHALGFESPFHFSRAFKQRTGMPPSQWRTPPAAQVGRPGT
jgi:AraC-like DNA-binding protein